MIENVEELTTPPVIGKSYLVPCVLAVSYFGKEGLYPVLTPSHDDSDYARSAGWAVLESLRHYHVDARFGNPYLHYGPIKDSGQVVQYVEMTCLKEMPILGKLYKVFGKRFYENMVGTKMKCFKCPHRGINLASMPVIDGVISCPAHGLKFSAPDYDTIVSSWSDSDDVYLQKLRSRNNSD